MTAGRYKLFTSERYRRVVIDALRRQRIAEGIADDGMTYRLGLVAGKVYRNQESALHTRAAANGWLCWTTRDLKLKLAALSQTGYANNQAAIMAKLLLRD